MKKLFYPLLFCAFLFVGFWKADAQIIRPSTYKKVLRPEYTIRGFMDPVLLEDGVYKMTVYYESHTEYKTKYTLNVEIANDTVVCIYFPDGGYVHPNSRKYRWYGGGIQWYMSPGSMGMLNKGKCGIYLDYGNGQWQSFQMYFNL